MSRRVASQDRFVPKKLEDLLRHAVDFERDMVIYLLYQTENENDRLHFCIACGRMFRTYVADDCRYPECQAEQIDKSVVSLLRSKSY